MVTSVRLTPRTLHVRIKRIVLAFPAYCSTMASSGDLIVAYAAAFSYDEKRNRLYVYNPTECRDVVC